MSDGPYVHLPYTPYDPGASAGDASEAFRAVMNTRRSVRDFSERPVPRSVIETLVRTAASSPSGAHKQPWHFVCVSDPAMKRRIREAAEAEEQAFYEGRAPQRWLDDLAPLGTNADKPFLERAPWLIVVFKRVRGEGDEKVYYVNESVGIASGVLIAAIHCAGLVTLTHTPSPMGFLGEILARPKGDKAFLLLPVGYPADNATVPDLQRKPLADVATFVVPDGG